MANITDYDFSNCLIDPNTHSDRQLTKKMSKYPEFKDVGLVGLPLAKVIKYIIIMYDYKSEMKNLHSDISVRKRECALLAGFEMNYNNKFSESVEDMLIGEIDEANDMIVRYIRLFNSPDYMAYVANYELLIQEIKGSLKQQQSKDIKVAQGNIKLLHNEINELTDKITNADNTEGLRKALYKSMERDKLVLRPEDAADMIFRKEANKIIG